MTDPQGKRNGDVIASDFETQDYIDRLSPVVERLQRESPDFPWDTLGLARLIASFLQFMEDVAGKNGVFRGQPKIPMSLFRDFKLDGPIYAFGLRMQQIKATREVKVFEFGNPLCRKDHLEFYGNVRRELLKLAMTPKIYIEPSCLPADQIKVREVAERLGAQVAASSSEQGLTHRVFPFPLSGDPDDGQDYLRVQEIRGDRSFVHWWYLPESYDEYVSRDTVTDQVDKDPISPPSGVWKVYLRWVYDSEKFNEWMSPVDYETQEAQEEHGRLLENLPKPPEAAPPIIASPAPLPSEMRRLAANKDGMPAKRSLAGKDPASAKRHKPTGPEVLIGKGQTIAPGIVRHSLLEPHRSIADPSLMASENVSQGQLLPHAVLSRGHLISQLKASGAMTIRQTRFTPSWFSFDSVHEVERQALPEFFNLRCPSKTPETYIQIRNVIVRNYLEQEQAGLAFKAVQGLIAGDRNASRRVHDFLTKVNVIHNPDGANFSLSHPPALYLPSEVMLQDAINSFSSAGSYNLISKPGPSLQSCAYLGEQNHCSLHPVDCSGLRYSCTVMPNWQLCPACFAEGCFPPGLSGKDFVRIDCRDPHQADKNGWTLHESSLLFAGLELFGDNWATVAEHVGTKTQVQCILRFLQMPIDDVLLDGMECGLNKSFPFKESPNPILAQAALLASIISPEVAAASAVHALGKLCQKVEVDSGPENISSAISAVAQVEAAKEGLAGAQRCAKDIANAIDSEIECLCFDALCQQSDRLEIKVRNLNKLKSL